MHKKTLRYILPLLAALWLAGSVRAAGTLEADTRRHRLSIAGRGGLNTLLYRPENAAYRVGGGGSVGIGYDFYFLPFMGIGSGLEFSFLRASYRTDSREYACPALDNDPMYGPSGEPFTFHVAMENEHTVQQATYLYIPLMLRFRVKWFTAGAGAKVGFPLRGSYDRYMGTLKTTGEYARFPEAVEDMPGHGFVSERAAHGGGSLRLKTDWALSVDFGITYRPRGKGKGKHGRVPFIEAGVFADYGLRNLNRGGKGAAGPYPVTYNPEVYGCIEHHDGLENASGKPVPFNSLAVGVRVAVGLNWR
ncbi:MAG: outer membrane beta-barrel protein [Bacteroides sp.]|nr:outer membrane beta-barrel protein [Bacteroides sp.]